MNPILQEYCQRYKPNTSTQYNHNQFFTSLDVNVHWKELPYFHDIQNFCLRVLQAYQNNERVCIYSDYDTDAVTATATMYHGLLDIGFDRKKIDFYAPDRFVEGYGMNTDAIKDLVKRFDLIISVDCGINSTIEAQISKNSNCDMIITDHHHLSGEVPDCISVINCRLGEYYNDNQDKLKKINNEIYKKVKYKLTASQIDKLDKWLEYSFMEPNTFQNNPEKFCSSSVTGVGVAWFGLVWFAYFLEYVGIE